MLKSEQSIPDKVGLVMQLFNGGTSVLSVEISEAMELILFGIEDVAAYFELQEASELSVMHVIGDLSSGTSGVVDCLELNSLGLFDRRSSSRSCLILLVGQSAELISEKQLLIFVISFLLAVTAGSNDETFGSSAAILVSRAVVFASRKSTVVLTALGISDILVTWSATSVSF